MATDEDLQSLSAYLDGELEGDEAQTLEERLRREPELADTLSKLREGQTLLRSSVNAMTSGPVPSHIADMIKNAGPMPGPAAQPAAQPRYSFGLAGLAAAAVVAFVVAAPLGFFVADQRMESRLAQHMEEIRADRALLAQIVSDALEQKVSGEEFAWQNPKSGSRISITPVRTFKNKDGTWCREYLEIARFGEEEGRTRSIACRVGEGLWQKRLATYKDS